MMNAPISGFCTPEFQHIKETFIENFVSRGEVGASCTVIYKGRPVVDLWGGWTDSDQSLEWQENTISLVFSCTKAAVALCAHHLIDQGKLELDALVADYWPEFAQNGKDGVTVRMMLNHQSALPALREPVAPGGYYDFDYMVDRLAKEAPFWKPGTDNGYHMITFGWTVGELIRRVSGQSLGRHFKDNIATPLGLDFHIGLPESEFERMAKMVPFSMGPDTVLAEFTTTLLSDPSSIPFLSLMNNGGYQPDSPDAWRAEIGGGGGISNARSLARMFDALLGKNTLLSKARIEDMRRVSAQTQRDKTLLIPTRFGQGFMLSMDNRSIPGDGNSAILGREAFGHVGMGGSIGFADPEADLAFGYTMTNMGGGILLVDRGQALVDATYTALGYEGITEGFWRR